MSSNDIAQTPNDPPPTPTPDPQPKGKRKSSTVSKPRKVYDPLLEAWYFNEINKRDARDAQLFKNYQINPYTKKTLDYVTPKIPTRRRDLPKMPPSTGDMCSCGETHRPTLSKDDLKLLEDYKIVKSAIEKSVNPPKKKFCEPQTEMMRLGWFPTLAPPPPPRTCLYMRMNNNGRTAPCCYFYPTPSEQVQDETYDERFRAVHTTAEFIRTEEKLKQYDAIMNPNGYRGQRKTVIPRQSIDRHKK